MRSEATSSDLMSSSAWISYRLKTTDAGVIEGVCETNDNLDRGCESEHARWAVSYAGVGEMRRRTGGCHTGISGIRVEVYLDGARIEG
jgi:hypothetical protein